MFSEIDKYLDDYDGENAYKVAKKLITKMETDYAALFYRFAHACYIRSNHCMPNDQERRGLLIEAHKACRKAYKMKPNDSNVLKWCSIITGSLAEISGNREKIELGHEFKKYLDEATELTPDSAIFHMRGRFSYEVANLSWLERTAATALFGAPPNATIDGALADLLKAEKMCPGELDNSLYIAKCYLAKGDQTNARAYLMRVLDSTAVDEADEAMIEEANDLLKTIPNANESNSTYEQTTQKVGESKTESSMQKVESGRQAIDSSFEEANGDNATAQSQ